MRQNVSAFSDGRETAFPCDGNGQTADRRQVPVSRIMQAPFRKRETGRTAILYINTTFFQLQFVDYMTFRQILRNKGQWQGI